MARSTNPIARPMPEGQALVLLPSPDLAGSWIPNDRTALDVMRSLAATLHHHAALLRGEAQANDLGDVAGVEISGGPLAILWTLDRLRTHVRKRTWTWGHTFSEGLWAAALYDETSGADRDTLAAYWEGKKAYTPRAAGSAKRLAGSPATGSSGPATAALWQSPEMSDGSSGGSDSALAG